MAEQAEGEVVALARVLAARVASLARLDPELAARMAQAACGMAARAARRGGPVAGGRPA